jgi:hypothetical protein
MSDGNRRLERDARTPQTAAGGDGGPVLGALCRRW